MKKMMSADTTSSRQILTDSATCLPMDMDPRGSEGRERKEKVARKLGCGGGKRKYIVEPVLMLYMAAYGVIFPLTSQYVLSVMMKEFNVTEDGDAECGEVDRNSSYFRKQQKAQGATAQYILIYNLAQGIPAMVVALFLEICDVIAALHRRGFSAKHIHSTLRVEHGVNISYVYLRCKVLAKLRLARSGRLKSSDADILRAYLSELQNDANHSASVRVMLATLRTKHHLNVTRDDVTILNGLFIPELVALRQRGRLHRRTYATLGSNYIWHVDGYDKLAPYGFPIHGCIDGFARYLLWLEVGSTNHDPRQTCHYFVRAVQLEGVPHTVRVDAGTENVNIITAQRAFNVDVPRLNNLPPVIIGSSNHNERIERFWGILRMQRMNWWILHFKALCDAGLMVAWDVVDRHLAQVCYMSLIRNDLNAYKDMHNHHVIRSQRNNNISTGIPRLMYRQPETYGLQQCKSEPRPAHVVVAQGLCREVGLDANFQIIVQHLVVQLPGVRLDPVNCTEADALYRGLRPLVHLHLD